VESFARLHAGLLDLGNATPRKYGGGGFTISGPSVTVQAVRSQRPAIVGQELLDDAAVSDLATALRQLRHLLPNAKAQIRILRMMPQHVGLGSKTALVLAALKAIDVECQLGLTREALQRISRRGGTSGIGINAFFDGGFLIDGGHDATLSRGFGPSSTRRRFDPPSPVFRCSIPGNWRFHLLLPQGKRYSANDEVMFFGRNTPLPRADVFRSIATMYHSVLPAVLSGDLELLKTALFELHRAGFKRREVRGQSPVARRLLRLLSDSVAYPVGLSSMGPLIYVIATERDGAVASVVKQIGLRHHAEFLGIFSGQNFGFNIVE
jgi:beta-ribofuranosylaminobenzene 5'-phosphate synthase